MGRQCPAGSRGTAGRQVPLGDQQVGHPGQERDQQVGVVEGDLLGHTGQRGLRGDQHAQPRPEGGRGVGEGEGAHHPPRCAATSRWRIARRPCRRTPATAPPAGRSPRCRPLRRDRAARAPARTATAGAVSAIDQDAVRVRQPGGGGAVAGRSTSVTSGPPAPGTGPVTPTPAGRRAPARGGGLRRSRPARRSSRAARRPARRLGHLLRNRSAPRMLSAGGALGRTPGGAPPASFRRHTLRPSSRGPRRASLDERPTADCHSSITALWWPSPVGRHLPVGRPERTPPSRPPGEPGTHRSTGVNPAPGRTSGRGRAASRPNPSANPVGGRRKNGEPPDGVPLPCTTPPAPHPGAHPHLTARGRPQRTPRGPTGSRAPALDRHLAASPRCAPASFARPRPRRPQTPQPRAPSWPAAPDPRRTRTP